MVYGISETDNTHETLKKIVELKNIKEDLSQQLMQEVDKVQALEKQIKAKDEEIAH